MFFMYDSVDVAAIPESPHAVLAYINGAETHDNYDEVKARFPHLERILKMSVTGWVAADGYDIEKGDYTVSDVPRLYTIARDAGIWRPLFYAQLSGVMPEVKSQLNTVVKARSDVRLMVAYYNEEPELPAGFDAHQFTKSALGRNLDESICASDFFQPVKAAVAKPREPWQATVTVDTETGKWDIKGEAVGVS